MSGPTSPDDDAEASAGTPDELAGADQPQLIAGYALDLAVVFLDTG